MNINCKIKDIGLWLIIVLFTIFAFFCTYHFEFSSPVRIILWIFWLTLSMIVAYFTELGNRAFVFIKEAKIELQKVVWPTRQETVQTTSIVMIMVAVTGFVLWGIDSGMMWVIAKITHLG